MTELTHREYDCMDFIEIFQAEKKYSPSYDKIMAALGLHSKSGVHRMVNGLVAKGFVEQIPHRHGLKILKTVRQANAFTQATHNRKLFIDKLSKSIIRKAVHLDIKTAVRESLIEAGL